MAFQFLGDLGYTGPINKRWNDLLTDLGYTGTLQKKMSDWVDNNFPYTPGGDAPVFTTQPTMDQSIYDEGDTVVFTAGAATPVGTLTVESFTLDGVDKTGELSGLTWDTSGEDIYGAAGLIALQMRATNVSGFDLSNVINATLRDVPDAFVVGNWSIADGASGDIDVTISALPDNGNASITDVEYRVDSGTWTSSGGTVSFTITGLDDGSTDVELRAINSVGSGAVSDLKSVVVTSSSIANLSNFDGTDEATTYTEESTFAEAYTFNGSSKLDSENTQFGATALRTGGGSNDSVTVPSNIDRSADGLTMEWFRANNQTITANANGRMFYLPGVFQIYENTTNTQSINLAFDGSTTLTATLPSGTAAEIDTMRHYYLELDHGTRSIKLWYEGTLLIDDTLSNAGGMGDPVGQVMKIGNLTTGFGTDWDGWMDGLRIVNGLAGLGGTYPTTAPNLTLTETRTGPPAPGSITFTTGTYTRPADGNNPTLSNTSIVATNTTGPYYLDVLSVTNGTTPSQTDMDNGSGTGVLEKVTLGPETNIEDLDGSLDLSVSITNGRLYQQYRDSTGTPVLSALTSTPTEDAITYDAVAPTFSSAEVGSVNSTSLVVTFNKNVYDSGSLAASDFDVQVDASGVVESAVSVSGTDVTITIPAVANGETVTVAYNGTALVGVDGEVVATFTAQSVTNNVSAGGNSISSITGSPTNTQTSGDEVYQWDGSGSFVADDSMTITYIIQAGGGGGGGSRGASGGGGGAGEHKAGSFSAVAGQTYTVTVGTGGAGGTAGDFAPDTAAGQGADGGDSGITVGTNAPGTALGGGAGGTDAITPNSGGSGGGAGGNSSDSGGTASGDNTNAGGSNTGNAEAAGGGGATAVGGADTGSPSYLAGTGGAGIASTITGSSVTYATGGDGGGGGSSNGANGTDGLGDGGEGAGHIETAGGDGGNGRVTIRFTP